MYYFLFDVFPKPQSNTTDTFTPSEIAFFVCFSVTLVKPEKPLKVPEVEKFYKLPDSRAVVEFRINTGFTASCFFGTLLIVFAEIKDFYEFTRCRQHTTSTCTLIGNISVAFTFLISYPFSRRYFTSRAKVAESQLTYTILSGSI